VDLGWTGGDPDPGDNVTYEVYFEANDSTPDEFVCNGVTSAFCDPGTLGHGTHYYWRVVARDEHGATTTGLVWDFTTEESPDTLTLISPNGGENWHVGGIHDITWSSTGSIATVRLEYSKDGFISDVHIVTASTPNDGGYSWTVPNDPSTTVRVRVSGATNPSINDVSDGEWVIFNNSPNTPSNPSPTDGAANQSVDVDLRWTGGDPDGDSVTYDIYLEANDSTPDVLVCSDAASAFCDPGTLSPGTHYYWRVVAGDEHGATTTGPIWDFTTYNNPPNTPSNPSPADGATDQSSDVDLSWTGGDPDGDSVTYDVYLEANDSTPGVLVCNDAASASCDPGTLSHGTHYYWRVVARDEHGATTTGPIWDFTTYNNPPNTPSNPSPVDGATDQSSDVDLSWTGGDPDGDSVTYDVYLEANDSTPDVLVCNDAASASCDPGTLGDGTHYYWQVVARDEHGATTMGQVWEFITSVPPPIVQTLNFRVSWLYTDLWDEIRHHRTPREPVNGSCRSSGSRKRG